VLVDEEGCGGMVVVVVVVVVVVGEKNWIDIYH
jgi:Sec-independent protein translocase protein TatA